VILQCTNRCGYLGMWSQNIWYTIYKNNSERMYEKADLACGLWPVVCAKLPNGMRE
jgi:hypothetical protein